MSAPGWIVRLKSGPDAGTVVEVPLNYPWHTLATEVEITLNQAALGQAAGRAK